MRRYELGMSMSYVSNWTVVDAVREFFQNSLDEEIQNPENKWFSEYDEANEVLRIGNKLSKLSTSSLLLGCTTKENDDRTIGQHGEGYKVATIVLLRNGCGIKIYNYNEKQVWSAKVINSRRYNAEIGVYDVDDLDDLNGVPENNLVVEITGITADMYKQIKEKNLWLQDDLGKVIESEEYGRVLLDEKYCGKIFVKGLYVCYKSSVKYGYDLDPCLVDLDRDRGLIDSFDLQYALGQLIANVDDVDFINDVKNSWDGYYIKCFDYLEDEDKFTKVFNDSFNKFIRQYGKDAYPVTEQADFNKLRRRGYNSVLVSDQEYYYISNSPLYTPLSASFINSNRTVAEKFGTWFERIKEYLPEDLLEEGLDLAEDIERDY